MATITVRTGDAPGLEEFLVQRIYEYNAAATGYHDGESFTASYQTESGNIEAGTSGCRSPCRGEARKPTSTRCNSSRPT
jgi:hypothetical protein